jgi:methyl-accepting chemotaxis protein
MNTIGRRIIGIILVILAVVSLIITVYGIVQIWQWREPVIDNITDSLDLAGSTLQATADGLVVVGQSLDSVINSISGLESTVSTLAKSIEDSAPLVSSLSTLTGDVLPQAVSSAQTSLESAQDGARIIDTVLRALTILNRSSYEPQIPLHEALGEVSEGLNDIPESLTTMEDSLNTTYDNLEVMQAEISLIAEDIGAINEGLEEGKKVIEQYQELIADMQTRIDRFQSRLPSLINTLAWVLTFILVWLGITQIGLLVQGVTMSRADDRKKEQNNI